MAMDFIARALAISASGSGGGTVVPGYSKLEVDAKINTLSNEIEEVSAEVEAVNSKVDQVDDILIADNTFVDDVVSEVLTNMSEDGILLDGGTAAD